jgi:hypothetical protein
MSGLRSTKPSIITYTLGLTGVENSQALPNNIVDLKIRLRDVTKVAKIAFVSTESGTNYFTLDTNHPSLVLEDIFWSGVTIYAQGTTDNVVLEIMALI